MVTDHDYIYTSSDLQAIAYEEGLTFLPSTEVSTEHGHVLYYGSHPEIVRTLELSKPQLSVKPGGPEFFDMVQSLARWGRYPGPSLPGNQSVTHPPG